ncbi:uncharacterized protein METZ01_LOCUS412162, partial [marine metagenome]
KSDVDFKRRIHKNYLKIQLSDLSVELFSVENFLYIEDVIRITDEIGLEIIDIFGDYNKGQYDENSNEIIFICKKRKFY